MDSSKLSFAGLQQPSHDPNLVSAVEKLLEEHSQPRAMMAPLQFKDFAESLLTILKPVMEDWARKAATMQAKAEMDLYRTEIIVEVLKWLSGNEPLAPERQHLELKFIGKFPQTIYTGEDIKGEEGGENSFIQVALVDADGNNINSGPEASLELEISVVADDDDDEDSRKKLRERPPILSKNKLKLKDGFATLKELKFRNRSKWTKGCRIKLLAKITGNNTEGHPTVKEATSESFLVRDCRSLYNNKHKKPLLSSEAWRLNGIPKKGNLRKLLEEENIKSVKDFLICHNTEPQRLQQMLGISDEKLAVIVDHAKTCEIPNSQYSYYSPRSGGKIAVVFNVVGCVQGIINEDNRFAPVENLSEDVKGEANQMVISAFQNPKNVKLYDNEASTSVLPSQLPIDTHPSSSAIAEIPSVSYSGPFDHSFSAWNSELDILDMIESNDFQAMLESNDVLYSIINDVGEELFVEDVDSSKKAKGRWKRAIMTLLFVSLKKRKTVAPEEHSRSQKKQKRD